MCVCVCVVVVVCACVLYSPLDDTVECATPLGPRSSHGGVGSESQQSKANLSGSNEQRPDHGLLCFVPSVYFDLSVTCWLEINLESAWKICVKQ